LPGNGSVADDCVEYELFVDLLREFARYGHAGIEKGIFGSTEDHADLSLVGVSNQVIAKISCGIHSHVFHVHVELEVALCCNVLHHEVNSDFLRSNGSIADAQTAIADVTGNSAFRHSLTWNDVGTYDLEIVQLINHELRKSQH